MRGTKSRKRKRGKRKKRKTSRSLLFPHHVFSPTAVNGMKLLGLCRKTKRKERNNTATSLCFQDVEKQLHGKTISVYM